MGKEIERKFLVKSAEWQRQEKSAGEHYRQGYLVTEPSKTIRVRVTETGGFLTIKGLTVGATRPEYEYEIPVQEAAELLDLFAVAALAKVRYKINYAGKVWEVDEFSGQNEGLVVAEIELNNEEENFDRPDWIGDEVTNDPRYYNANLTIAPFTEWIEDL